MGATAASAPRQRIGRFEIVRVLGKGAQGTVYLARDTHLGREVAVKTLRLDTLDPSVRGERVRTLLDEARIVSRLQHPNIVTLFDAGDERGTPYLVFEYVEGRTLADLVRRKGRLPCGQAVDITRQILLGIALAHAKGVVHRDLKPANIIMTGQGIPRVMDFGIARQANDDLAGDKGLFGTPNYMAPEYVTTRRYTPVSDLFSVGMVLYEMLAGRPAVKGVNTFETLHQVANVPFPQLSQFNSDADERLVGLVMKAIAKDPAERFDCCENMAEALAAWLEPEEAAPAASAAGGAQGTLEFVLRRIRHKSDFPALSTTIATINRVLASDRQHSSVLSNTILRDFALTNKILKLVNSAYYNQYGGKISTISRAVSILGVQMLRNVAMTLTLFDHLQSKTQATWLRDEVVVAYFSGILAREFVHGTGIRDAEEAFICAMYHRLGRLLVRFYLHDEVQAIERIMQSRGIDEGRAATQVLGISYEDLGIGVATSWNFPKSIVASMRALTEPVRSQPDFENEKLRVVSELANNLSDVVRMERPADREKGFAALIAKYARGIRIDSERLKLVIRQSAEALQRDAEFLGFKTEKSQFFEAALSWIAEPAQDGAESDEAIVAQTRLAEPDPADLVSPAGEVAPNNRQAVLAAGVQDIINTLVTDYELNDVLRIILETMYRGIGFTRVLLCVSDAKKTMLRSRFGFGRDVDAIVSGGFSIPIPGQNDVFHAAIAQGADIRIKDIDAESVRRFVPAWYRKAIRARGMVLFPVVLRQCPVALIYADADDPLVLRFRPEELALLRSLRNQAVLAFKQRS